MNKRVSIIILLFIGFSSCFAQKKQEKLVRKCFNNYKTAILNDKGEDAVNYVDSRTIKYYSYILDLTKNGDSTEVDSLGIMDKLMVFSIRHRASRDEILSFDGKGLIAYAINEGMVGKNSVMNNTIGDVKIDGLFATGQLIANGEKSPLYYNFYYEQGAWKFDLTSLFPIATASFLKIQEDSGQEVNEFLFTLLEMMTGRKPGNEIWNKIK